MDPSLFLDHTSKQQFNAKSSPVTSTETSSSFEEQILEEDIMQWDKKHYQLPNTNLQLSTRSLSFKVDPQLKQQHYQQIECEIMSYFEQKGVEVGNPGDYKKQFNKKLHKRVAMMTEVNQVVAQKANAGSSLLSRRLYKKMTVTL